MLTCTTLAVSLVLSAEPAVTSPILKRSLPAGTPATAKRIRPIVSVPGAVAGAVTSPERKVHVLAGVEPLMDPIG